MVEVIVAVVGGLGLVLVAVISNRGRQHAKAARDQVENSHETNLREEGDERHNLLVALITGQASDIRGIRRDIGRFEDRFNKHLDETDAAMDRIRNLEDTIPGVPPPRQEEP